MYAPLALLPCLFLSSAAIGAQTTSPAPFPESLEQSSPATQPENRSLPDPTTLMKEVEAHQRAEEALEKDYIYRQNARLQSLDSHGNIKHINTTESDIFYVDGVAVVKRLKKDDKDLTDAEKKKEDESIDKEVKKAHDRKAKAESQGKQTDSNGHEIITVSRILELGTFSNERRVFLNGRDTIVLDYAGDPKAKTKDASEDIIRDLIGTVWVDEQDKVLAQAKGTIVKDFKVGAGLVVDIRKGTNFLARSAKINDEAWLPSVIDASGKVRALLFFSFDGNAHIVNSDYRKFKATSTILPGINKVEEQSPQ